MVKGASIRLTMGLLAVTIAESASAQTGPAGAGTGPGVPIFQAPPLEFDQRSNGFELGGQVRAIYDSNLLRLADDIDAPANRSRDDMITTVQAVLRARISPGLQSFFANAAAGRDYHAGNEFLDRQRINVDGGWDWRVTTRCAGRIAASYTSGQADLAEQGAIVRNRQRRLNAAAGGGCEVGLGFTPSFDVSHRMNKNSSIARRGANAEVDAIRAGLAYNRTGNAGLAVGYRDERFLYPNRIDPETGRALATDRKAAGARVEARLAGRTSLAVLADYNWLRQRDSTRRFREVTGGFTATYRPIPRMTLNTGVLREVDAGIFVAASYVLRDRVELNALYAFSPRTRLSLRAGVERNRYRDPRITPGADVRSFDRLVSAEAVVDYRVNRAMDLRLEARHSERVTDGALGSFEGTRVGATLRIAL